MIAYMPNGGMYTPPAESVTRPGIRSRPFHRGRVLTYEELEHYCKVVTALRETMRLMAEIDAAIPRWPVE
jgi:hypothetical protein